MTMKNLFGILLLFLGATGFAACSDDDDTKDPADTVTLNMLNEENGTTRLGESDLYINKSNNFATYSCYIAEIGKKGGLGADIQPQLNNLTREAAVVPGHLYQIYDRDVLRTFPSGNLAIHIGTGYYKMYVVSPITDNNATTGAAVKYALTYPDPQGLPEYETHIGSVNLMGDSFEYALPANAECAFNDYLAQESDAFDIQAADGKLTVKLLDPVDNIHGPYGTYGIYVRAGTTYTLVEFNVGMGE